MTTAVFLQRLALTLGGAIVALLVWRVADILLLAFAGLLLAVLLNGLTRHAARIVPLPRRWRYPLVLAALVGGVSLAAWALAPRLVAEAAEVRRGFPAALDAVRSWLAGFGWGERLIGELPSLRDLDIVGSGVLGSVSAAFSHALAGLAALLFVAFVGIFVAADPAGYRDGALQLVPPARRAGARRVLDRIVATLGRWLLGQLLAMATIGLLVFGGLAALGMPFALVIGVLAGVLEFVPVVGALVGGAIAVTLAFAEGPHAALYVLVFYLVAQQLESNVILPLVQRYTVELAPALTLVATLVVGSLFGVQGLVVATPLVVVVVVTVKALYLENASDDGTAAAATSG